MKVVLDASVLIALVDSSDTHYQAAVSIVKSAQPGGLFVHPITLAEFLVGAVRAGKGKNMLRIVDALGIRTLDGNGVTPLEIATVRHDTGLKLPDSIIAASAIKFGAKMATFDRTLEKRAAQIGIETMEPSG